MQHQQPLALRGLVDAVLQDLEVAEAESAELAEIFVVVARHIDHASAVLGLTEQRAQHVVVFLWPIEGAAQRPEVDDVTDEIEVVALDAAEEIEQRGRVAAAGTEVDVRDEYAADGVARDVGGQEVPRIGLSWRDFGE